MSDAPPPYPGINQNPPNYAPPSYNPQAQGPPVYPPQNPSQTPYGYNGNAGSGNFAPPQFPNAGAQYPSSAPGTGPQNAGPSYPTLPTQAFGFNAPSAPGQPSKSI